MITENQAERLLDQLTRIGDLLQEMLIKQNNPPMQFGPLSINEQRCGVCGGNHGNMPCPKMTPTC